VSDRIDWPPARVVTLCRWLLARAAEALPPQRRADWLAEWEGELWALWTRGVGPLAVIRFAMAALFVARWEIGQEEGVLSGLAQDFRIAIRRLRGTPGFALVVAP
jgi:hypothetical protein